MNKITITYDGTDDDSKLIQGILDIVPSGSEVNLEGTFKIEKIICLNKTDTISPYTLTGNPFDQGTVSQGLIAQW